jgi:hypothetical protein
MNTLRRRLERGAEVHTVKQIALSIVVLVDMYILTKHFRAPFCCFYFSLGKGSRLA